MQVSGRGRDDDERQLTSGPEEAVRLSSEGAPRNICDQTQKHILGNAESENKNPALRSVPSCQTVRDVAPRVSSEGEVARE